MRIPFRFAVAIAISVFIATHQHHQNRMQTPKKHRIVLNFIK